MDRDRRLTGYLRGQTDHAEAPPGFELNSQWRVGYISQYIQCTILALTRCRWKNDTSEKTWAEWTDWRLGVTCRETTLSLALPRPMRKRTTGLSIIAEGHKSFPTRHSDDVIMKSKKFVVFAVTNSQLVSARSERSTTNISSPISSTN